MQALFDLWVFVSWVWNSVAGSHANHINISTQI